MCLEEVSKSEGQTVGHLTCSELTNPEREVFLLNYEIT